MTPDARLLTVVLWALCATPATGQVPPIDGWSLGFTSSARETVYPGGGSGSSSSDRRLVAVGVSTLSERSSGSGPDILRPSDLAAWSDLRLSRFRIE